MYTSDIGCACSCNYDYEPPTIYKSKLVKAYKNHICCECGETISKGELHESAKGLWDGYWAQYRTCLCCYNIRSDLCKCGFIFGELRNTLMNEFGFDYLSNKEYEGD